MFILIKKIMRKLILVVFICIVSVNIFAQYTLKGRVKDKLGDDLIGATVYIKELSKGSVVTSKGNYIIKDIAKGKYTVEISYIGYKVKILSLSIINNLNMDFVLESKTLLTEEIVVQGTRAGEKTPVAHSELKKEDINKNSTGNDIPFLLNTTPSIVTTSETGTGLGYTALRIRGSDQTRINVTVNGIPLNDSESQGVFWVNMTDFVGSVDDIQIQRGVGTSTNGAGAFGGTINFQTTKVKSKPYSEVISELGSYNTFKNSVRVGTGILNSKFTFDARYSRLKSEGYIQHSALDHESYFITAAFVTEKSILRANLFSGNQKTGITWWGISKDQLKKDRKYNPAGVYFDENGNEKYYKDQTDNYKQTHYQLIYSNTISEKLSVNGAFHYTQGSGYYEQYKDGHKLYKYGFPKLYDDKGEKLKTDVIRRKMLANDFYGGVFSARYKNDDIAITLGGAYNKYDGDHFGKILWTQANHSLDIPKNYEWYRNNGTKFDGNLYLKANYQVNEILNVFADLQYRGISYKLNGIDSDDDLTKINQKHTFDFFNPKFGAYLNLSERMNGYFSFGVAQREPTRSDFINDTQKKIKSERLKDFEVGLNYGSPDFSFGANFYYMSYKDQLVNTGVKDDVGYDIRTNVDRSFRKGIEIYGGIKVDKILEVSGNITISQNKIEEIDEVSYNESNELVRKTLSDVDIAYSPNVIASAMLTLKPIKNLNLSVLPKFVGEQYFDNTQNKERMLDSYFVTNASVDYTIKGFFFKEIVISAHVNNVFNKEYITNAYYYEEAGWKSSSYFPAATRNFIFKAHIKF